MVCTRRFLALEVWRRENSTAPQLTSKPLQICTMRGTGILTCVTDHPLATHGDAVSIVTPPLVARPTQTGTKRISMVELRVHGLVAHSGPTNTPKVRRVACATRVSATPCRHHPNNYCCHRISGSQLHFMRTKGK